MERVLTIAAAEVGYIEGQGWSGAGSAPNNWTVYGEQLDMALLSGELQDPGMGPWRRGSEWCATFERWALLQAGIWNLGVPGLHLYTVLSDITACQRAGVWLAADRLQAGDFWMLGLTQDTSHTGMVEAVNSDGTYRTIEGNLSRAVRRHLRRPGELRGGWRPPYTPSIAVAEDSMTSRLFRVPGRAATFAWGPYGLRHIVSEKAFADGAALNLWANVPLDQWQSEANPQGVEPTSPDVLETLNGRPLEGRQLL